MTQREYDKMIHLLKHGALHNIDTGRLDGECEDVIPLKDAIAIIDGVYKVYKVESEEKGMTKEDRDKLLIYLTEQTNIDMLDCRLRIAKEDGIIEGLQIAAAKIADYIKGQAESEEI